MRRTFWFGAGVAAGVALTRKINETTRKATPNGMAEQLGGAMRELAGAVGSFGADVRAGMSERENELYDAVEDGGSFRRSSDTPSRSSEASARATARRARRAER